MDVLEVNCPVAVEDNAFMGGVDMADQNVLLFFEQKNQKMVEASIWRLFDQAILNALIIYREPSLLTT